MNTARHKTSAFTLAELMVSLAIASVLMAGLGSAVLLATRAVPDGHGPAGQVAAAASGLNLLATEMYYAQSFSSLQPNSVSFTVAPRGSDTSPETITYSWSGVAGSPVLRQYDNGPASPVINHVSNFALTYNKRSKTTMQNVTVTTVGPEQQLASFTGWSGITPTTVDYAPSSAAPISEYFQMTATPPAGAVALTITRARLFLKAYSGGASAYTVGLYAPGSGVAPSATAMAGPVTVSSSTLGSTYAWTDIYFTKAVISNPSQNTFCLVVSAPTSTPSLYVQYLSSLLAPSDADVLQWYSGGAWGPALLTNQQDMPFYCFGAWSTPSVVQQPVTDYYLQSAGIVLQTGADSSAPMNTTVEVYNQPKVTGL
jgi:prepilin-type N-terminal cleavage/methylation domain-containing protein